MSRRFYQIDAFAERAFKGNPAAVVLLDDEADPAWMQSVAAEFNLSETAFVRPGAEAFGLRWFTPTTEVDLCGHATLASAFLILTRLSPGSNSVRFETRSGGLHVTRYGDRLFLDFPAYPGKVVDCPADLSGGLGVSPQTVVEGPNYVAVLKTEAAVAALQPDMTQIARLHPRGVIATAPGDESDFVSRFFGPSFGVPEDPVTGSAHCMLIPYWAQRTGK